MSSKKTIHSILEDPEFKELARQKNRVSLILTIAELTLYFGFIALVAYDKPLMGSKLAEGSATTVGIPIAVGVIVLSWALTGIYIFWANSSYDEKVERVKKRFRG